MISALSLPFFAGIVTVLPIGTQVRREKSLAAALAYNGRPGLDADTVDVDFVPLGCMGMKGFPFAVAHAGSFSSQHIPGQMTKRFNLRHC